MSSSLAMPQVLGAFSSLVTSSSFVTPQVWWRLKFGDVLKFGDASSLCRREFGDSSSMAMFQVWWSFQVGVVLKFGDASSWCRLQVFVTPQVWWRLKFGDVLKFGDASSLRCFELGDSSSLAASRGLHRLRGLFRRSPWS